MTDQPDLPPELIDPIANIIFRMRLGGGFASTEIARAVAPMLIAHGRELEKAEVVAWLRSDVGKGSEVGVDYAEGFADAIERNEHRIKTHDTRTEI